MNLNSILKQRLSAKADFSITLGILRNGPDPQTDQIIKNFQQSYRQNALIKKVIIHQSDIKLNPPEARNYLFLQHPDYDYYVFIDDDAYFKKNYFAQLNRCILQHSPDLIGGPNYGFPKKNSFQKAQSKFLASAWCGPFRHRYMGYRNHAKPSKNMFILCNLVVAKTVLEPFAENIKFGEELFLLDRLFKKSCRARYMKDLVVFHHRRESKEDFLKQIFKYGLGRGEYLASKGLAFKSVLTLVICLPALLTFLFEQILFAALKLRLGLRGMNFYFAVQTSRHYFGGAFKGLMTNNANASK